MASRHLLCARLARLLWECSLEAGHNGMVDDAKRIAKKVGIEYWSVEATCRRSEEALFGRSGPEGQDLASESTMQSPVDNGGIAEPRRIVKFVEVMEAEEDLSPSSD